MGDTAKNFYKGSIRKRTCLTNGVRVVNGRFEVLKCIHSKGMANVYIVQDLNLGKQWCLKEIRKSQAGKKDVEYISLLQEANILRTLSHERIPRITEIEDEGDSLFVIMDFLDGTTLRDFVESKGKIPEEMAVKWMLQIVQTMGYLHSEKHNKKPIFYRDMKPDNIMIRPNGAVNIFDFGISIRVENKNQKPDYTLGTPGYVAPEQKKRDLPVDLRSDIYAMGRTFYFMLTGVDPRVYLDKPLKSISDWSPEISLALTKIVERCMSEDPEDRYQDCEELQYALENYQFSDEKYKTSAKRKVAITLITALVGTGLAISSIIPFSMNKVQEEDEYTRLYLVAQQSGKLGDYERVLDMNPLNLEPYLGYIDALKSDGIFSRDEESILLNKINPNLIDLKADPDYGRVAYEIGRLYWFYYEDDTEDDGKILAIKWFEDAIAVHCNEKESEIYRNIGIFRRDIAKSIKDATDDGMYKDYWDNLLLSQESTNNDLVTIQTYISISECIATYSYNLKKDGVKYEDIMSEIGVLQYFTDNYNPEEATLDTMKDLYIELSNSVSGLEKRVNTVYGMQDVQNGGAE